ncbi:WYL domain-containing protein [uncultured Brevibacillus sp.]|uniref:WYL domain-containing protein n=1 Tax=uncultured Brevibacillus sp. TaxID=169970 RepID=UPI00259A8934|nr:WYL domain-containing protein [uncultured Brevibacillus sp.]
MNPFEKIFNYQLFARLHESSTITITAHERSWLKTMLAHPAASQAFQPDTLSKLQQILEPEETYDIASSLIEKAKSVEKQVYHPLLRQLRRVIASNQGVRITYQNKNGRIRSEQSGFPYKLEYSMVKREWYLLWYHLRHHSFMATRFQNILSVAKTELDDAQMQIVIAQIETILDSKKEQAVIEVVRSYNKELSRILYAFSCFEKDVEYEADTDTYRITVTFLMDDREYILSKMRFLGKRVRIVSGQELKERMLESSEKALARYGMD